MSYLANIYKHKEKNAMSEVDEIEKYIDTINLSIGDPDLNTNKEIIKNAAEDADNGHTHYTNPYGDEELISEIVQFYETNYSCIIDKDEVFISAGAGHGLYLSLLAILNKGDEVIIHEPYYTPYKEQIGLAGGITKIFKTYEEDGFIINIEKLRNYINSKTKAIILNYPNNPTGACINNEKLKEIADLCIEKNIVLISDEVYSAFSYNSNFYTSAKLENLKDRTITIGSFSKNFAMTGWRVGYIIAESYIIECIKGINDNICYSTSSVSQRAALHAMKMRSSIQPQIIAEYSERLVYGYKRINSIRGISCMKPDGAIYLFVKIKDTGLSSKTFSKLLYEQEHVLVIPGIAFGDFDEYVRIAVTVDLKKLEDAFNRIENFCENRK